MRRLILVQAHHEYPGHNNFKSFHISFPNASAAQSFSSSPLRNIFRIRMVFFIRRKNRLAYKKYKITDITKRNVCLTKIYISSVKYFYLKKSYQFYFSGQFCISEYLAVENDIILLAATWHVFSGHLHTLYIS